MIFRYESQYLTLRRAPLQNLSRWKHHNNIQQYWNITVIKSSLRRQARHAPSSSSHLPVAERGWWCGLFHRKCAKAWKTLFCSRLPLNLPASPSSSPSSPSSPSRMWPADTCKMSVRNSPRISIVAASTQDYQWWYVAAAAATAAMTALRLLNGGCRGGGGRLCAIVAGHHYPQVHRELHRYPIFHTICSIFILYTY